MLRSIGKQSGESVESLLKKNRKATALNVLSRLDYCNAVLADLSAYTLAPFQ